MPLRVQQKAPDFCLPSTSGQNFCLYEAMQGKACILYFYPKDFTPGCTTEACDFRDNIVSFRDLDVNVFGISRDTIASHQKFKEAHQLPFELLSDAKGEVCKAYQALIPLIGIPRRVTYLLDPEQKILAVYENMLGAKRHIRTMLEELKNRKS